MIIYKFKTAERRRKGLQDILDRLIKLKADNDGNRGMNLYDNEFYEWYYSNNDMEVIKSFLTKDLTLPLIKRNSPFQIGRIAANNTYQNVYNCLKSRV